MTGEPFSISSDILTADNDRSTRAGIIAPIPSFGFTPAVPGNVGPGWMPSSVLNAATTPFGIPAAGTYGNQGRNDFNRLGNSAFKTSKPSMKILGVPVLAKSIVLGLLGSSLRCVRVVWPPCFASRLHAWP